MKALVLVIALVVGPWVSAESMPKLSKERIIFHTNIGDIVVALYPEIAPLHAEKILRMVRAGLYEGIPIGRIEKGFVAQVFNYDARQVPLSAEQHDLISKIPAEFSAVPHTKGILSMAREDGDINSGEFSFSFLLGEAPHLNQQYTAFGEVVAGRDVLSAFDEIPTNLTAPVVPVMLERAEVLDDGVLSAAQLEAAKPRPLPFQRNAVIFEIFAGLMFFFTVATPIYKSIFFKPAAASKA